MPFLFFQLLVLPLSFVFTIPISVLFLMIPITIQFLIILVSLSLVLVVWQDCAYVLTISNHKIFVVKRVFIAEEQGTVS